VWPVGLVDFLLVQFLAQLKEAFCLSLSSCDFHVEELQYLGAECEYCPEAVQPLNIFFMLNVVR